MTTPTKMELAERLEAVAIDKAALFVSSSHWCAGKSSDIYVAANAFAVAQALRALAAQEDHHDQG